MFFSTISVSSGLLGGMLSTYFVEKVGRRPILLTSLVISVCSLGLLFVEEYIWVYLPVFLRGFLCTVVCSLLIFVYYFGIGPIPDFVIGTIFVHYLSCLVTSGPKNA